MYCNTILFSKASRHQADKSNIPHAYIYNSNIESELTLRKKIVIETKKVILTSQTLKIVSEISRFDNKKKIICSKV